MFEVREHISKILEPKKIIQISNHGQYIPLNTENWPNQWFTLPEYFVKNYKEEVYEFEVRDDDVFVVTFPKSGTTWMQETAWLLINDLDFVKAKEKPLFQRSLFLDFNALFENNSINTINMAGQAFSPRLMKSHLPAPLLPHKIWENKTKLIYCARNPKDVVISLYNHMYGLKLGDFQGNIDEFVEAFMNDDVIYSSYWHHIMDFWKMRNQKNIFFITYEEMQKDLGKVLIKLNRFLEKPDLKEEDLKNLLEHLSFENMKANDCANYTSVLKSLHNVTEFEFMRRGIVGSFKDELSVENQNKLDQWIKENLAKYNIELKDIFGDI